MDLSKLPWDKAISFIAGIVPGFVALVLYHTVNPAVFDFMSIPGLGYRTKVALFVSACFLIGNSLTVFLNVVLYLLGHLVGRRLGKKEPFKPSHTYTVAPWRDSIWRTLLKKKLSLRRPERFPLDDYGSVPAASKID